MRTLGHRLTLFNIVALMHFDAVAVWDRIRAPRRSFVGHHNVALRLTSSMRTLPVISEITAAFFGFLALKQLFNARKTLRDILCRRDTAGVEGTHGELCARLADRLRGDDADRLADGNRRAVCKVRAVALGADAALRFAGEHRTDFDAFYTGR